MKENDFTIAALTTLQTPELDPRFASRVGALARTSLRAPGKGALRDGQALERAALRGDHRKRRSPSFARLRSAIRVGLVPALLTLAAIAQTAATADTMARIYGGGHDTSSQ